MIGKLKCIIVDDDPFSRDFVKDNIEGSSIAEITDSFASPKQFLAKVSNLDFELALLDISMPDMSGFEVAKRIPEKSVIFITAYNKNFSRAIEFPAIDIISKPYTKERLIFGLEKARRFIKAKLEDYSHDYDLFKVENMTGLLSIKTSEIVFVKADEQERRHKNIILKDGKTFKLLYCTFEQLLNYPTDLVRINKSELLSRSAVSSIETDLITTKIPSGNNKFKQVTLSEVYRKNLKTHNYSR